VLSGLSEGDRVVVGNVGLLGRGMQVQILGAEGAAGSAPGTRAGNGTPANGGGGGRPAGAR
jgi:hypothetical protein